VSDVAHELKTPLTALMLVGDSLASGAAGRQMVLVERLQRELLRLQVLVSDLLELTRLDNATPAAASGGASALDPRDVLGNVWSTLEPLAQERRVRLAVNPGRDQARVALVDAGRLHQALLNLLENALHYSPDDSSIDVTLEERDRWCLIEVRDRGPGLSDTDLERMFQRFYRGDPARARSRRSGSGLGLAIVKQIASAEGGLVRASNHPDGGAVLELLLPRPARSAGGQVTHHQLTLAIQVQPALIPQHPQHPSHGDAGGAQGAGDVLVGEAQVEPQALVAGLAVFLRQQLQEAAHAIFDAAQPQQGDQGLRLAHAAGHGLHQGHGQVGGRLHLIQGEAEQIAVAQGRGLVEIEVGERFAEGFVGARQGQEQILALLIHATQLHHAAGHQPHVVAQQGHLAAGAEVHQVAPLEGVLQG
jgi:anti-sigma regulatory factor (Ser/Thr protein kinase)